ncbi:MAG: hypothetical protein Q8P12_06720, partial [bacterium]|nr:hypothetical protein [bacterium]
VRVLTEPQAYLINDILSDFNARTLTFGGGSQLGLNIPGHTVAVKTGTTNDNRDNWAIGYTPAHKDSSIPIVIAAWIGNNDNSPMNPNFFAGSARIWNGAMTEYLKNKPDVKFSRPKGIVSGTVDSLSGMAPGPYTQGKLTDIFAAGTIPTEPDNWHVKLQICKPDGKLASDACIAAGQSQEKVYIQMRAERPEWQDDLDAWVAKTYKGQTQYFPPKQKSTLCFNSGGQVVSCTGGGTGPIVGSAEFYDWSGNSVSLSSLPKKFEVKIKPTSQPGSSITFVRFWLEGNPSCTLDPDSCNVDTNPHDCNNEPVKCSDTTPDSQGYYSSKDNGTAGEALFQLDDFLPGTYKLHIYAEDNKGGFAEVTYEFTY